MTVIDRFALEGDSQVVTVRMSMTMPSATPVSIDPVSIDPVPLERLSESEWETLVTEPLSADLRADDVSRDRQTTVATTLVPTPVRVPEVQTEISVLPTRRPQPERELPTVTDVAAKRPRRPSTAMFTPSVSMNPMEQVAGISDRTPADFSANAPPEYPADAVARRLEGTVKLRLIIDVMGRVERVEIVNSSGHGSLDRAAIEAVQSWQGQPAKRYGRPVASEEVLPIRFRL
ncbi:protein containing TonB [Rhodopirellula maiorica SM1]|uniref:Protein containing TonB n=2 Tax=Novipirellula TaxID=2795426 RepID=M5R9H0_9BACT|nr:protein containing TonB [Rhodopirellula maiorica SM1]